MAESVSNFRPLAIFSGYMALAAALTASCVLIICKGAKVSRLKPRRKTTALFSALAVFSLATTWYHMFCFFRWSYEQWATAHPGADPAVLHLGAWLRDTTLFKQAWASTLETAPRAWWSLQIFGFCAHWSVMLAVQQRRRRIPYAWAFMLLGQVVAISFASNLFFLAVLLRDPEPEASPPSTQDAEKDPAAARDSYLSPEAWYNAAIALQISIAVAIPKMYGQPGFMRLLLGPHVLAFAPLLLNGILPGRGTPPLSKKPSSFVLACFVTLIYFATAQLYREGVDVFTALETLHEHPAVGSVGWDVICCWISYSAWHLLGSF